MGTSVKKCGDGKGFELDGHSFKLQTLGCAKLPITTMAAAIAAALFGLSGSAYADPAADASQSAPASAAPASTTAAEPIQLERVVVSANKRIERLEDVPMAITVLDSKALDRHNVVDFTELPNLSPALSITYGSVPSNNSINMRGIGTVSTGVGLEADVAVVIDDIPMGMQVMALAGLADVGRIEILKGPQSTLFGKNAVAGAVNITTKPITGPMVYTAGMMYTSDNEWQLHASASGRTSDQFGFRIAATASDFPGIVDDLSQDTHTDGARSTTFAGKFEWDLTKDLELSFSPHYNHSVNSCCVTPYTSVTPLAGATVPNTSIPASTALAGISVGPTNTDVREAAFSGAISDDTGAGLKLSYNAPGGYVLSSITSADIYEQTDQQQDGAVVAIPLLAYGTLANGQLSGINLPFTQYGSTQVRSQTQEFRLVSPDEGAFRYVAGLWFAKNEIDRNFIRGYGGIVGSIPSTDKEFFGDVHNTTEAVYGQSTWDFMPDNSLITGLRVNREVSGYDITIGATPPPLAFVPTSAYSASGVDDTSVTGRLGLEHHFNRDVMAYVTASTGHKGYAYNLASGLSAVQAQANPVSPESSRNFEIGFKANLLNNRATLSAAVFHEIFKNYQQQTYVAPPINGITLDSIGGVQTHGLELESTYLASQHLMLNASAAYTVATVSNWSDCGPSGTWNCNAFTMPNAPKVKLNAGAQYDIPLQNQPFDGFISADYRFQSAVVQNLNIIANGVQDMSQTQSAYRIVNLGFGIKEKKDAYKLSFFVNNLFNQQYSNWNFNNNTSNPLTGAVVNTWLPARDAFRYYGLRFDVKF